MANVDMATLVNHLKSSGYVYAGSEIYGGLSNAWDFGPLGVALKNNIKQAWWKKFITESDLNVGLDAAIIMNPSVWQATGHVAGFSDAMVDCKECKSRFRADQLIEQVTNGAVNVEGKSLEEIDAILQDGSIVCPKCGKTHWTQPRNFNLMFKTFIGTLEDNKNVVYLRPETAQGIFVNFKNVQRTSRKKVPFGIGQIGKAFRNEITPGNFIFRTREFEQMELEFFCKPGTDLEWFEYWESKCVNFIKGFGVNEESLRLRPHAKEELAFYSKATSDIEFLFPFGWGEIWGIADRTDYDLKRHMEFSKESLEYLDPQTNEKYVPYCIEPSVGVERLFLMFACNAYEEQQLENDSRIVMHLHPALAPIKACVCPLTKKLSEQATEVFHMLQKHFNVEFDEAGSIGKRYRRQDAIGTPFCITYDFDSLEDGCVTIRHRDSMEQERVAISDLVTLIEKSMEF